MKKFKSLITEFSQEPKVIHTFEGPFTSWNFVRIGIEDVEFSSGQSLDKWDLLGKEVTIIIGDSESEVPKQELPVIPKYVADWWGRDDDSVTLYGGLQVKKKHKFSLISNFHDKGLGDYLSRVEDWIDKNDSAFLDLVNGKPYEVEEEPMYYALIKGHDVSNSDDIYWNYDKYDNDVFVSRLYPSHDNFLTEMSKSEWSGLGINDSNADFVKVEE